MEKTLQKNPISLIKNIQFLGYVSLRLRAEYKTMMINYFTFEVYIHGEFSETGTNKVDIGTNISIQFDSKENFENKYQGNWYNYYY